MACGSDLTLANVPLMNTPPSTTTNFKPALESVSSFALASALILRVYGFVSITYALTSTSTR